MLRQFVGIMLILAATSAPAKTAPVAAAQPAQINRLLACRSTTDAAARLACFDRESMAMSGAIERRDIVVVDREEVRRTRRSLFGLSLPSMALFGGDKESIDHLDGVLAGTSRNRDGGYVFKLEDGSRWTQTDDRPFALEPRAGEKILVKRAMMGSYMLVVGRQPGVRVQRLN